VSWFCVCGKEYDSVREAEDCCGDYVSYERKDGDDD